MKLLVILMMGWVHPTFAQSFQSGLDRRIIPIEGSVTVICPDNEGGEIRADFICRDRIMEPSPYDQFSGPKFPSERGLKLELTARDPQGGSRTKESEYSGQSGLSLDRINLWISNPFQKPLLKLGRNWVQYKISNRQNRIIAEGEVISDVNLVGGRFCPKTTYRSNNLNDCGSQYTVCQQYFEQFQFCH